VTSIEDTRKDYAEVYTIIDDLRSTEVDISARKSVLRYALRLRHAELRTQASPVPQSVVTGAGVPPLDETCCRLEVGGGSRLSDPGPSRSLGFDNNSTVQAFESRSFLRAQFGCWILLESTQVLAIGWQRDLPRSQTHLGKSN
jgi:hypothetical protein